MVGGVWRGGVLMMIVRARGRVHARVRAHTPLFPKRAHALAPTRLPQKTTAPPHTHNSDVAASDKRWRILLLRYFNPIGAHPSGDLGEHPVGVPNNLMPYVQQVALGQREFLRVFGGDYPTPDGTAVRDYIHVMDLAEGHVSAVVKVLGDAEFGCKAINLGARVAFVDVVGVGVVVVVVVVVCVCVCFRRALRRRCL